MLCYLLVAGVLRDGHPVEVSPVQFLGDDGTNPWNEDYSPFCRKAIMDVGSPDALSRTQTTTRNAKRSDGGNNK